MGKLTDFTGFLANLAKLAWYLNRLLRHHSLPMAA